MRRSTSSSMRTLSLLPPRIRTTTSMMLKLLMIFLHAHTHADRMAVSAAGGESNNIQRITSNIRARRRPVAVAAPPNKDLSSKSDTGFDPKITNTDDVDVLFWSRSLNALLSMPSKTGGGGGDDGGGGGGDDSATGWNDDEEEDDDDNDGKVDDNDKGDSKHGNGQDNNSSNDSGDAVSINDLVADENISGGADSTNDHGGDENISGGADSTNDSDGDNGQDNNSSNDSGDADSTNDHGGDENISGGADSTNDSDGDYITNSNDSGGADGIHGDGNSGAKKGTGDPNTVADENISGGADSTNDHGGDENISGGADSTNDSDGDYITNSNNSSGTDGIHGDGNSGAKKGTGDPNTSDDGTMTATYTVTNGVTTSDLDLCSVSESGAYGDITTSANRELISYIYEVETITALDEEILQSIKAGVSKTMVEALVDGCNGTLGVGSDVVGKLGGRKLVLVENDIVGISPKPGDRTIEGEECIFSVDAPNQCSVVQGRLTIFANDDEIKTSTKKAALDAIKFSMNDGAFEHESIVRVTYLGTDVGDAADLSAEEEGVGGTASFMGARDQDDAVSTMSPGDENVNSKTKAIKGVPTKAVGIALLCSLALVAGVYYIRARKLKQEDADDRLSVESHLLSDEDRSINSETSEHILCDTIIRGSID